MSVEFRQRTPSEYAQMVWKNKWLIVMPTIVVALAVAWVVRKLPNLYESKSVLVVRPATISANLVARLSESDLVFRINSIHQEVTSRSSLEPLIQRYGLYKDELARKVPMEALIQRMQTQDIQVDIDRSDSNVPNAFNIFYRSNDPNAARSVTAELAGKYVSAQLNAANSQAVQTTAFFEQRVAETKDKLDDIDRRRLDFMRVNIKQLPDNGGAMTQQLMGLYEQQKGYVTESGRMRDAIAGFETQLNLLARTREQAIEDAINTVTDPKNTEAYARLIERRSQLRNELAEMRTSLREKNPDVIAKQKQIADVQGDIDDLFADRDRQVAAKRKELAGRVDTQTPVLREQMQRYRNELSRQQSQLAQTNAQIAELERRLSGVPGATIALQQLDREYSTQKTLYDELLSKAENAKLSGDANSNSQGETIQVIDAASLPQEPVAPKRQVLYAFGLALGMGCGIMLAALREVPRLMTVQNTEDAEHYTHLPVLVSLPEMLTPSEIRRARLRRLAFATAGLVVAVVSVPALIVIFRFTRIFDILSGVN